MFEDCEHKRKTYENRRIVKENFASSIVVKYDYVCQNCGQCMDALEHKYKFSEVI